MESFLIGSFQKPSSRLSFPFNAELCSYPSVRLNQNKALFSFSTKQVFYNDQFSASIYERYYELHILKYFHVRDDEITSSKSRLSLQTLRSQVAGHVVKCKAFSNVGRLYTVPITLRPQNSKSRTSITLSPRRNLTNIVNSSSGHSLESDNSESPWSSAKSALNIFYRALSIVSVSLLAVEKLPDLSPLFFTGVLEAVVAALLMNIYVVGLNQLTDIEIDKVNKPYLPLASGEYSVTTGVMIVASFAIFSFWLAWVVGSWPLFWALFISFLLGTAYSINVPFFRWKRFAVAAAMCIFAVRALIVQIAFFLHVQTYLFGRPAALTRPVIFATAFMSFFSVVIALFKFRDGNGEGGGVVEYRDPSHEINESSRPTMGRGDIPDIVGDKIYGIQSFTVRLGQERVFWICILLLEMAYAVAFFVGITSSSTWSKWTTVIGHTLLGLLLWNRAKSCDWKSKASITSFYMFIWKIRIYTLRDS
ncbi:hypoxanthine-guanine phosphoribosyltransferase [Orobanche hederae]